MRSSPKTMIWLSMILVAVAMPSAAQDSGGKTTNGEVPYWGTSDASTKTIAAPAFMPFVGSTDYSFHSAGYWSRSGGAQYLGASVSLPTGVKVTMLEVEGCDSDGAGDVRLWLSDCLWSNTSSCPGVPAGGVGSSGTPGCHYWNSAVDVTIYNGAHSYYLTLELGASGLNNKIRAARIYYQRQISPAPGFATFNDVGTGHWAFQYIEALAASGITGGCGGGAFCPNKVLTRAEMAIFLSKALGLHWAF